MKTVFLFLLVINSGLVCAQKTDKYITAADVSRVIGALSGDAMMGRSSLQPEYINRAADFIEGEFKAIGLKPLKGASSYRQEFRKERIRPDRITVDIDGERMADDHVILVSEKASVRASNGLSIHTIGYDASITNPDQYFMEQAFGLIRDTSSMLILVAPEFGNRFRDLKSYFGGRFTNNWKFTKVFVLGKTSVNAYTIEATQVVEPLIMANVVGVLEGKKRADELVVFSGHYDHLGLLQPNTAGDSIANGADDDASGTTAVITLARYFKKLKKNKRTLVFVAFTAEEIGGYGSQHFSKQLDPEKVVAMFNIEMIGKASKWGKNSAFITGFEKSDFGAILQKNLEGTDFRFYPDPYVEQNLFYRSDNATLARLGVPAHTISTDQIDIDKLYHTVDDEFSSMDIENITNAVKAIALSAKTIVSGKDTPKRIDKSLVH